MVRRPAVAGTFYEGTREGLREAVEACFLGRLGPGSLPLVGQGNLRSIVGLVSPHAGYIYSGAAAAHAYRALACDGIPDVAIILGPNHHGLGAPVGVSSDDEWLTPLGSISVDTELANAIVAGCRFAQPDELSHSREHSIEVQLPFLQFVGGDHIKIVPISIAHLSEEDALLLAEELGDAVASALADRSAVVIASTDFSHYESKASAQSKDMAAMERILDLDGPGLIRTVNQRSVTMCGAIGTAAMLEACRILGATTARKLAYYTSGDVTGDTMQVVGYGALSVERH